MIKYLLPLLLCLPAHAKTLRWGADFESGAPYSFKDPKDPERIIGYESEIVEAVAREMGMEVQTFQNNWEGLIEGLKRGDYDIVVNGLEITPDRAQIVNFSPPYYITAEVMTVRKDELKIVDLESAANRKIGTLVGSLAQRILASQDFPFEMITYSEEVHAYNDLALGRIDAVFLDEPIALYYGKPNPQLKIVGPHVGRLEYGIATRLDDKELTEKIQKAITKLTADGTIRRILEKWGLWNTLTAKQWKMSVEPETPALGYNEYLKTAWKPVSLSERLKTLRGLFAALGERGVYDAPDFYFIDDARDVRRSRDGVDEALRTIARALARDLVCRNLAWHSALDPTLPDFLWSPTRRNTSRSIRRCGARLGLNYGPAKPRTTVREFSPFPKRRWMRRKRSVCRTHRVFGTLFSRRPSGW